MRLQIAKKHLVACVVAASSLLALACSSGGGDPPPGNAPPPGAVSEVSKTPSSQGINGTPLYAKTLGPDHSIEMYEFSPGVTAVREVFSIDNGQTSFLDGAGPMSSLAGLFGKLNPDSTEVPAALGAADERAARLLAEQQASQTASIAPPEGHSSPLAQEVLSGATGCSGDNYGDGWGGQWFTNNYCNAGGFRFCQQNWGNAYWNNFSKSWVSWRQMEGDFNLPGHITLQQCHCGIWACGCPNQTDVDHDVLPRHIEIWNWSPASNAYASGSSQCGHLQLALLWNN